jgi:hypothetical protein
MAQDERPVDSAAKAICCGPARQCAAFQGDDPELAAPCWSATRPRSWSRRRRRHIHRATK